MDSDAKKGLGAFAGGGSGAVLGGIIGGSTLGPLGAAVGIPVGNYIGRMVGGKIGQKMGDPNKLINSNSAIQRFGALYSPKAAPDNFLSWINPVDYNTNKTLPIAQELGYLSPDKQKVASQAFAPLVAFTKPFQA